jgi:segregation and condensation protein B
VAEPREETSFRSLLAELDVMEEGLKTDFDDLLQTLPEESEAVATEDDDEPLPDETLH